jgi:ABC-type transporter Mla subunit MlaD
VVGEETPLNLGSLEGDARFLLGQIAQVMRDLPARMTRFEQTTADTLQEIKDNQKALAAEVTKTNEVLDAKIDQTAKTLDKKINDVANKQHFVSGAWAAIAAVSAGIAAILFHRA